MAQSRFIILIAVTLGLGYFSALSLIWNTGRTAPEFLAATSLYEHPTRVMDAATLNFRASRGEIGGIDIARLQSALALAPLEEEPFIYAAVNLAGSGEIARAEELLRIAVRRNPRSLEARILLLDLLLRRGSVGEAITQVEVLFRLIPERREQLSDTLVYLTGAPSTREEALAAITENRLKIAALRDLSQAGASASMLLDSLNIVGELELEDQQESFTRSLIGPLITAGDWQGALRLWRHFNPTAFANGELVLDPKFAGDFDPPFGWATQAGRDGYAQLGTQGLAGEFYGRRKTLLANQVLVLDPGDYQLSVSSSNVGRGLAIEVDCSGPGEIISGRLNEESETFAFSLTEECPFQTVSILGLPMDPPRASAFVIEDIQIERAGE